MKALWVDKVASRCRPGGAPRGQVDNEPGVYARRAQALNWRLGVRIWLAALMVTILGLGSGVAAAATEIEPNNSCQTAQDLGVAPKTVPTTLTASLAANSDVDFYKITGTPGGFLRVTYAGASNGHDTLQFPILATYTSACFFQSGYFFSDPLDTYVQIPPDGILIFAVTSTPDYGFQGLGGYSGSYTGTFVEAATVTSISGRVVDAVTNMPISGAQISLNLCADPSCATYSSWMSAYTDPNGGYTFPNNIFGTFGGPLLPGTYQVSVYPQFLRYLPGVGTPFNAAAGATVVVPDVALTPVPVVSAITGRLIDASTRKPLSGVAAPHAHVALFGCGAPGGCSFADIFADDTGRFVIRQDNSGLGIPAGYSYSLQISADQYLGISENIATHTAGETVDVGDILVVSNPIRFGVVSGCNAVPSIGGSCTYTVTVTNGADVPISGAAWMTVSGNNLNSFVDATNFQVGGSKFSLAPATRTTRSSKTLQYQFYVPGDLPLYTTVCPTFWFGADPTNNYLGPLGRYSDQSLCLARGLTGFALVTPAQATALRKEARSSEAKKRAIGREQK